MDVSNSQNLHFSKAVSLWLFQKFKFIYRVFLGTLGLGKVFVDFLDRKITFPDHKNTDLKRLQNLHFSKRVSPWVWLKISNFFIVSKKILLKKVFADVLDRKLAFLDHRNTAL